MMRRPHDLVVLVPDKDIEQAITGVLDRPEAIGMRRLKETRFVVHPQRDPGVYHSGHQLIEVFSEKWKHALVCFDRAWEGAPPSNDRRQLAGEVEKRCRASWGDRIKSIVIDPEIEAWVWSDSPHVATALGWNANKELRDWLRKEGIWEGDEAKPPDPKRAFEAALRHAQLPPSAAVFRWLAKHVSFQRCSDPAFRELVETLRLWFPAGADSEGKCRPER